MKYGEEWQPERKIIVNVPQLQEDEKIYFKDIITLQDALGTFATFDYYLDFVGYKLDTKSLFLI